MENGIKKCLDITNFRGENEWLVDKLEGLIGNNSSWKNFFYKE